MKNLLFLLSLLFGSFNALLAQVNESLAVQVMVVDPGTQQVRAHTDVTVKLELRHNAENGEVLTEQTFPVKTDAMGVCTLMFDVADNINWGDGSYYIATFIDGEESSVSKLCSVPYALTSKQAVTADVAHQLSGVITPHELVGKWVQVNKGYHEYDFVCSFSADGSAVIEMIGERGTGTLKGAWVLGSNGVIVVDGIDTDRFMDSAPHMEMSPSVYHNGVLYLNLYTYQVALKKVL